MQCYCSWAWNLLRRATPGPDHDREWFKHKMGHPAMAKLDRPMLSLDAEPDTIKNIVPMAAVVYWCMKCREK